MKLLLVKAEITTDQFKFYAQTESGDVPFGIRAHPDANGDMCLMQIVKVVGAPSEIEFYRGSVNGYNVEVWAAGHLEQFFTPDTKWILPRQLQAW